MGYCGKGKIIIRCKLSLPIYRDMEQQEKRHGYRIPFQSCCRLVPQNAALTTTMVSRLTWYAMQSTHLRWVISFHWWYHCYFYASPKLEGPECKGLHVNSIGTSIAMYRFRHKKLKTMQAFQLLNGPLKYVLNGKKRHNLYHLIGTQGLMQSLRMPFLRQCFKPYPQLLIQSAAKLIRAPRSFKK